MYRVRNQHQQETTGNADGLPSLFTVLDTLTFRYRKWVIKNQGSFFKSDAMFTEIVFRFFFVPFKISFHVRIVV